MLYTLESSVYSISIHLVTRWIGAHVPVQCSKSITQLINESMNQSLRLNWYGPKVANYEISFCDY